MCEIVDVKKYVKEFVQLCGYLYNFVIVLPYHLFPFLLEDDKTIFMCQEREIKPGLGFVCLRFFFFFFFFLSERERPGWRMTAETDGIY